MDKKLIFIFSSLFLLVALILSMISSNIQNNKSELLLKEIKITQDYNLNLAIMNNFFQQAEIFYNIENFTNYDLCNEKSMENKTTCISLESANTIYRSQNLTEELRYFYFNETFIDKIKDKSFLIFWLDLIQYLILTLAFFGQSYALLFIKEKKF